MGVEHKKLSPFDFINSINEGQSGKNLLEVSRADSSEGLDHSSPDKQYVPFIVNRGLSYFNDTVLFANEMNQRPFLPHKMQYDFLKHCIRPRKRFSKWAKKSDDSEYIKCIMDEYSYSAEKARAVFHLFTQTQLTQLKNKRDVGGNTRKSN
jgi:preprotein translocase subunit Sss1